MPMYRSRPFEARLITEDNRADIASLSGIENPPVGMYIYHDGGAWCFASAENFNKAFEEATDGQTA